MQPDVIIVGSGMGGATLAAALAPTGRHILILERGEHLRPTPHDRDANAIFRQGAYRPNEEWLDGKDQPFNPGNYHYVGGNSKFYGAALIRYRAEDFGKINHLDGVTLGWPINYEALEPDYQAAEELYNVRGVLGEDKTEPAHSGAYPFGSVPDEKDISKLRQRLKNVGLKPSTIPLGVDIEQWLNGGLTTWDAFPNSGEGKMDAETCGLATALAHKNVELKTNCHVKQLTSAPDGRVTSVVYTADGKAETVTAPIIVLACGAVQTAALLLASTNNDLPHGLSNRSDQVGRNFMNHNCSAVMALHPFWKNNSIYQKTLMLNDYYLSDGETGFPLGNVQMLGKITGPILAANTHLPLWAAHQIASRSFDFYAMSEDLPNPDSRVTLKNGHIKLDWQRSNMSAHKNLVHVLKKKLRQAGFPIVVSRPFDRKTPSHQCGTARMGDDPSTSVVDSYCRSHDHQNLFIVDASVLPTSAAVNPALTIAALALRAGRHITEMEFAA